MDYTVNVAKKKETDQLLRNCSADMCLCFRIFNKSAAGMHHTVLPRHEISIHYKCKEYLTDIQRLIRANKIMKYEIICNLYQGKIKYIFRTSFLTCNKAY